MVVLQLTDGTYQEEPAKVALPVDNGVYITYDTAPFPDDFRFIEGARIVGVLDTFPDDVTVPDDVDAEWIDAFTDE